MNATRSRLPLILSVTLLIAGIVVDAARAQFTPKPECLNPVPGCAGIACLQSAGSCDPFDPNAKTFTAIDKVGVNYTPCRPGAVANCPNPLNARVSCQERGWTGTAMSPCLNFVCGEDFFSDGC